LGVGQVLAQKQLLKDKLVGRILVIRNFYTEPLLRYDSSGHIKHHAQTGEWTVAQFKIEKALITDNGFVLEGKHIAVGYNHKKDSIAFYELAPLTIKVEDLPPDTLTQQKLDELTHQIFVVLRDEPKSVPDYWRDLVSGNVVADKDENGHKIYHLKGTPPPKQSQPGEVASEMMAPAQSAPVYRIGGNVKPPQIIKHREPKYSDLALRLKYEGITVLQCTLTEAGTPEDIRIIRPAGFGLDENAVQAVKDWTFKPATREGRPVRVVVNVEVNYRMR
jgi:TonB family protein